MPLGMKGTTFEYMQDIVYVSKPYLPNGQETLEPYINLYPEGSALSTAADMANYISWLLDRQDNRVLSQQAKKELFDRQFTMAGELAGMGCTWNRKTGNGRLYYDKKGETLNFYSRIALYPEAGAGIFFSSNTYLPEAEINALMDKAAALLYGPEAGAEAEAGAGAIANQAPAGEATIDISGYYVNHCSSFETAEKILRYLIPGKSLTVTGSLAGGFAIKGTDLRLTGRDLYESPLGKIKFLNREGEIILATESAITFSKAPFWQKSCFQVIPPLLFLALTLVCLLGELRNFSSKGRLFIVLCCMLQLCAFAALAVLLYKGISSFSLLSYGFWLKGGAGIILASAVAGFAYGINKKTRQEPALLLPAAWSLAGLLFSGWLYWLNLL